MNLPFQFGISGSRSEEYDISEAHTKKLNRLLNLKEADLIQKISRHYIHNFIPSPLENENVYWMCSCFPGNSDTALRFNIYWHEVLNIQETTNSTPRSLKWGIFLFTHQDYLPSGLIRQLESKIKDLSFDGSFRYDKGLERQLAARMPLSAYFEFVVDENVYESIRQYNYQLSCKGRRVHNGHNYQLVEMLLKR